MKQREKLSMKNIEIYEEALDSMILKMNLKNQELIDFVPNYRPDIDPSSFYITTTVPIPSCIASNIILKKGTNIPLFEYKIKTHGTMSHDFQTFKSFIEDGELAEFSFYGAVFDLVIFQDKKDKEFDTFNITFDSMYSLFDILRQQRKEDYKYRKYWFNNNRELIKNKIDDFNSTIITSGTLAEEIKTKSKIKSEESFYFESIGKKCSIEEAKKEHYILKRNIKDASKKIYYPKPINLNTIHKAIEGGSKIKVVSYTRDSNGELSFYYYK